MTSKPAAISLILALLFCASTFPWGKKAHKLINQKGIELLPDEMSIMRSWKDYIGDHASDPDIRKDKDTTEGPKHFIDIDYYPEFLNGKMIKDKNQLVSVYGEKTVTDMGLLPWATLDTYNNLKKSFLEKNKDKIQNFIIDLGHYVGDGHQPFHTNLNYDGQLTDQKGIHGRYESEMINSYIDQIASSFQAQAVRHITEPLDYIFDYITTTNSYSPIIFYADKMAFEQTKSHSGDEYKRMMWFRTKNLTNEQVSNASIVLASLIFTAWIDAGKPNLAELN
jgi:hypothetical protein